MPTKANTQHSDDSIPNFLAIFKNQSFISIIVTLVLCVMSYYIGALATELKLYKQGGVAAPSAKAANPTAAQPPAPEDLDKPTSSDHLRGSTNPKVALIEYTDFDCPYCANFHDTAVQALKDNPDLVWVLRHFPLSIHPNAFDKSIASECVFNLSNEDTFWKFADTLFEKQPALETLPDLASSEFGVNKEAFVKCMDGKDTEARVRADMSSATKAGVNGTPGNFLINLETGEISVIPGAQDIDYVNNAIQSIMK